jgi:hypothetical protein
MMPAFGGVLEQQVIDMKFHVKLALLLSVAFLANAQQNASGTPSSAVHFAGVLENVQLIADFRGSTFRLLVTRDMQFLCA